MMRYKRARIKAELLAESRKTHPNATPDEQQRTETLAESLQQRGLLIEQWDLDQIGADLDRCGLSGSPTKVYKVQSIVLSKEGYTDIPPTEDGVRQLMSELVKDRTLG